MSSALNTERSKTDPWQNACLKFWDPFLDRYLLGKHLPGKEEIPALRAGQADEVTIIDKSRVERNQLCGNFFFILR